MAAMPQKIGTEKKFEETEKLDSVLRVTRIVHASVLLDFNGKTKMYSTGIQMRREVKAAGFY